MSQEDPQLQRPTDFTDLFAGLGEDSSLSWSDEAFEAVEDVRTRPVISFRVGEDHFAIAADLVREIRSRDKSTALPGAPPYIEGILIVRRQVVALLSLHQFLELQGQRAASRVLIIESAHFTVGILVDEVIGLEGWPESALNPENLPENIRPQTGRFARGAHAFGDRHSIFLNMETLLDAAAIG